MKRIGRFVAAALAVACAFYITISFAQTARDPLIVPQEGGNGSRFQIVGQTGWTAGETVTISLGFSTDAAVAVTPESFGGPFYHERQTTVLSDGTWSFPISVDDAFLLPLDREGVIVVRAQAPSHSAANTFKFTPNVSAVAGAQAVGKAGFGPDAGVPSIAAAALFAGGLGLLLVLSGIARRRVPAG